MFSSLVSPLRRCGAALILSATLLIGSVAIARADVKIVTRMETSGGFTPEGSGGATTTTYYKGDKVRTEAGDTITLFDGATDKYITIYKTKKTYTTGNLKDTLAQTSNLEKQLKITTTMDLKPGGKTRTLAGKPAKNYLWTANISFVARAEALKNAENTSGPRGFKMVMKGETWATEAITLSAKTTRLASVFSMGNGIAGLKPFTEKLASIQGVPLSFEITQTMTPIAAPNPDPNAPKLRPINMTVTSKVVSISEDPLPDSLFKIPAGYKKMSPVATKGK